MIRRTFACLLAMAASTTASFADWPMYGRDLRHTFTNRDSKIRPANVALLQRAWIFPTRDAVTASPSVVGGVVYVGAWDGFFYAIDAATGRERWRFQVDCQKSVTPVPPHCLEPGELPPDRFTGDGGIITSSAAVVDVAIGPPGPPRKEKRVFFAGGKTVYSLRARDGALVWKKVICGNPEAPNCENDPDDPNRVFSSPAIYKRKVFVGHTIDGQEVEGKSYRGGFQALDVATGELVWRFEVDPELDENGEPIRSDGKVVGRNRSCGGVWSSAAIDEKRGLVFFDTADCDFDAPPPYHEAIIALDAKNGKPEWVFRPRDEDSCDFDFGASPNVIDVAGKELVGAGGKDGTYYALDRADGSLVWSRNVVFGGFSGGFIGSTAFDGRRIFGGTFFGELGNPNLVCEPGNPRDLPIQEPSMHALDAVDGSVEWQGLLNHTAAASSVADGVVFVGATLPLFRAYHAVNGTLLAVFPMPGAVNSSAAIVGDSLYVGSGNSQDGLGSAVHALRLPAFLP